MPTSSATPNAAAAARLLRLTVASAVARFGASRDVERQQSNWSLCVASIAAVSLGLSIVAVGILHARLYEIDRIVSRMVSYRAVTAVLVLAFTIVDLGLEASLASESQGNALAAAASTPVVFALFRPLRRRVQAGVDHRFDRDRYKADGIAAASADRLRDMVDPERVRLELGQVLLLPIATTNSYLWPRGAKETVR